MQGRLTPGTLVYLRAATIQSPIELVGRFGHFNIEYSPKLGQTLVHATIGGVEQVRLWQPGEEVIHPLAQAGNSVAESILKLGTLSVPVLAITDFEAER